MKKSILIFIALALTCVDLMMFVISGSIKDIESNTKQGDISNPYDSSNTELFEAKANEIAMRAANEDLQRQIEEIEFDATKSVTLKNLIQIDSSNATFETFELPDAAESQETIESLETVEDETDPDDTESDDAYVYIGKFKFTYYCPCDKCCGKSDGITASGVKATARHTIAVDPNVIPYGTKIKVVFEDGSESFYVAEDCGGAIKANRIDIYVDSHQEALNLGVNSGKVYICQ